MFVAQDYVLNGQGFGPVGQTLVQGVRFEPNLLRPFVDRSGRRCVTVNTGTWKYNHDKGREEPVYQKMLISELQARGINSPVFNASTLLGKDAWVQLDTAVLKASRLELRAWSDLNAASPYGGFDGMSKLTLEYQAMSDPGEAVQDMDGLSEGRNDRALNDLRSTPLPITHSDFFLSMRENAVSKNTSMPLDTTLGEASGRRVAELVEQNTTGSVTGMDFGTRATGPYAHTGRSAVYGYTTLPQRITGATLAVPNGTNAATTIANVIAMRQQLRNRQFRGPYMLYHTPDWDQWMDQDYILTGGNVATQTLRKRLGEIEDIMGVRSLDYLPGTYRMVMVQMTSDVARAVTGLGITTVMWEEKGGFMVKFKVLCIMVPQLRFRYDGYAGINDAVAA